MESAMKFKGVGCRQNGSVYLNMWYNTPHCPVKIYSSKFKTEEEGALFYDFARRYSEKQMEGVRGGGRLTDEKLNYLEYSRSLPLDPLPSDFDLRKNRNNGMDFILNQAKAAAANLPESLRRSTTAVGDPSPSNRSSLHQNVYRKSPDVSKGEQDLPKFKVLEPFLVINKHIHECYVSCSLKFEERQKLEIKVAGIKEGSGVISLPNPSHETFHDHMACLKPLFENFEQAYKSEESKCRNLRKILEDHNSKAIAASLMSPENRTAGRQRSSEKERFAHVPEPCPHEEQDDFGVPVGGSETCGSPASPPAIVTPGGTHTTMAPVEMEMSQPVALLAPETTAVGPPDLTECPMGDTAECIEEVRSSTNAGSPDWSHNMFQMGEKEFRIEDL